MPYFSTIVHVGSHAYFAPKLILIAFGLARIALYRGIHELLAPVESTPFITGIFGTPNGQGREPPQARGRRQQHIRLQLGLHQFGA